MRKKKGITVSDEKIRNNKDDKPLPPLTFWQVLSGVLSMAIGVQSEERRIRDFSRGKFIHFVIVGILLALLFIGSIATIVVLVLAG